MTEPETEPETRHALRVLFVDDEPALLRALRRLVASTGWHTEIATSGEEALEVLSEAPADARFDVVVADMRMPGMDGVELLTRVRDRYPATVRMILSGYTDMEASLRVVPVAHQFLTKPVERGQLIEIIERSVRLRDALPDQRLRQIVAGVDELPSVPELYVSLSNALASPATTIDDVAALIAGDPAVSAKLLKSVNSAFFGIKRRITDVRSAAMFLGMPMIRQLVLTHDVLDRSFGVGKVKGFSLARERRHALQCARLARQILPDKLLAQEAFLAAALHDIGKLILAASMPEAYADILAAARTRRVQLFEAEREVLGITHAEVGAYLLGLWGLPDTIVEAVAFHHTPERVAYQHLDVLAAVHIANYLVEPAAGPDFPHDIRHLDPGYVERIGVAEHVPTWRALADELRSDS